MSHVVRALGGASTSVWNDVAAAARDCVFWCLLLLSAMCIDVGLLQIPTPLLPASSAGRASLLMLVAVWLSLTQHARC